MKKLTSLPLFELVGKALVSALLGRPCYNTITITITPHYGITWADFHKSIAGFVAENRLIIIVMVSLSTCPLARGTCGKEKGTFSSLLPAEKSEQQW